MYKTDFMKTYEELDTLVNTEEHLQEANNKVVNRFNKPWYSGSFRGLNDISNTGPSPEELAKKAAEEEEARIQKAKADFIAAAEKVATENSAHYFNNRHRKEIIKNEDYPVVDPVTMELVYDSAKKEEILQQAATWISDKSTANALKAQQSRLERQAKEKERLETTTMWYGYATINGQKRKIASKGIPNETEQTECFEIIKQIALQYLRREAHECKAFGEPFKCSSKLVVTRTPRKGTEETIDTISLR